MFTPLKGLLDIFVRSHRLSGKMRSLQEIEAAAEVVAALFGGRAAVLRVADKALVLKTRSQTIASEVRLAAPELLKRLRAKGVEVKHVKCVP